MQIGSLKCASFSNWRRVLVLLVFIVITGCGGNAASGTVTPTNTIEPAPTVEPSPVPTNTATPFINDTASPTPSAPPAETITPVVNPPTATPLPDITPVETANPSPTITPTSTPVRDPIILDIASPLNNTGVEVGAVRIQGSSSVPSVDINGIPVSVSADGAFHQDIVLAEGVNLIRVTASDDFGRSVSQQIVVFFISSIAGLPFTLLYPTDGLVVNEPLVDVIGVTRPDAVVGINGIPQEVNSLGIFSARVPLEEGDNLIEIVATDIENVRFQTSVVFYLP